MVDIEIAPNDDNVKVNFDSDDTDKSVEPAFVLASREFGVPCQPPSVSGCRNLNFILKCQGVI